MYSLIRIKIIILTNITMYLPYLKIISIIICIYILLIEKFIFTFNEKNTSDTSSWICFTMAEEVDTIEIALRVKMDRVLSQYFT